MAVSEVTDSNFKESVLSSEKPVIVDFWAPWCQPCKRIAPVLEEMSESRDDVEFVKINVDDNPTTTLNYSITSIPTVARFEDGEIKRQAIGALPKAQLSEQLGL
ncbi:thioredoxin: thioredoxin [Rubrobacter radiotolerans]|uniref:Thioredoxin n=1 Tax=Rubrobacter radiotolerans TaxID=42256 RepID=A0A023WZZ6_RUBRA|nr:thioredoxin [Rubrobacter radiotolerans]AHY45802.1 thioredoxin: thioredoxin [Rubrobacter radiotolerans]MDX5893216.1 thioredoxin [Rubrobacter radiotolerans]SMC03297.1 thioredoxin [Rubrobacter radiotolerans DSM 5868]